MREARLGFKTRP